MKYFPDQKIEESLFEKFKNLPTNVKIGLGCSAGLAGLACIGALVVGNILNSGKPPSPLPTSTQKPAIVTQVELPSPLQSFTPTIIPTITETSTPYPTSTPSPIPREEVPFENPFVTMHLLPPSSFEGNLKIRVLAAGSPIREQGFYVYTAVKDITGMWSANEYAYNNYGDQWVLVETDNNGDITGDLPSGNYVLLQTTELAKRLLSVGWGIPVRGDFAGEGIPFTIVSERDLEITLNLGVLDIGLLNVSNVALYQKYIYPYCQGKDIAGKPIIDENRCKDPYDYSVTDNRGIARFLLGMGPYMLCYYEFEFDYDDLCVKDITINPGEYKEMRIIVDDTGYRSEYKIKDWWWCDESSC